MWYSFVYFSITNAELTHFSWLRYQLSVRNTKIYQIWHKRHTVYFSHVDNISQQNIATLLPFFEMLFTAVWMNPTIFQKFYPSCSGPFDSNGPLLGDCIHGRLQHARARRVWFTTPLGVSAWVLGSRGVLRHAATTMVGCGWRDCCCSLWTSHRRAAFDEPESCEAFQVSQLWPARWSLFFTLQTVFSFLWLIFKVVYEPTFQFRRKQCDHLLKYSLRHLQCKNWICLVHIIVYMNENIISSSWAWKNEQIIEFFLRGFPSSKRIKMEA